MIVKLIKKLFQRGQKKRKKKAQKRVRRFFRRLIGSVAMLGLAALGVYMGFTHRQEIKASVLGKILPDGKLKDKLTARMA